MNKLEKTKSKSPHSTVSMDFDTKKKLKELSFYLECDQTFILKELIEQRYEKFLSDKKSI
jgi:hypothetical protein